MDSRAYCFPVSHPSRRILEEAWFAEPGLAFQRAMYSCGFALGDVLINSLEIIPKRICVMASAEDADGIAKGASDFFVSKGIEVRLLCFWSRVERLYEEGISVAPILRTFGEIGFDESEVLVAVKSFVCDGTILKTNITCALEKLMPAAIHVLSPAMHTGLKDHLLPQFPESVRQKITFHTFVHDTDLDRDTGELKPGIGGHGYERFGLPKGKAYLDFPLSVLEILQR